MFLVRFDLRAPGVDGAGRSARHRAAVEMARHADANGCASIVISEHHASDDGYLPSPFVLAGAIAAATESTSVVVAASILPLHDPVRLAEDIITLDHLSGGRALVVLGVGYRPVEYELYGEDFGSRGRMADAKLGRLIELLEAASVGTDPVRVTPPPLTPARNLLAWGGRSLAAARRAGRHGISLFAQTDAPGLRTAYLESASAAGHEPGLCVLPSPEAPYAVFVADDPGSAWDELGGPLLSDAITYGEWSGAAGTTEGTASLTEATTIEELRRGDGAHVVVTPDEARALHDRHRLLTFHPLCGGLDPAIAWPHFERGVEVASAIA